MTGIYNCAYATKEGLESDEEQHNAQYIDSIIKINGRLTTESQV